ncbi:MAG: DUF3568 family protein [bacterium]|nr:DUF3568 family protein [bacterium]
MSPIPSVEGSITADIKGKTGSNYTLRVTADLENNSSCNIKIRVGTFGDKKLSLSIFNNIQNNMRRGLKTLLVDHLYFLHKLTYKSKLMYILN